MEDDGGIVYPGNALPNPLQSSRYTILKWKKFNINPQVAMIMNQQQETLPSCPKSN